ncbi:MAG: hypothetical protein HY953_01335, partial [Candidatus Rokubacteria bacterium]|nr:hypothetical protein [Candidatus Rokubacteria bacterium]
MTSIVSRPWLLGAAVVLLIAALTPLAARAGGEPTQEEKEKLWETQRNAAQAGRLPVRVGEATYNAWVDTFFSTEVGFITEGIAALMRQASNPYLAPQPTGSQSPPSTIAGDKAGKAPPPGIKPVAPEAEPEMVPVTQDPRKAFDWYLWY